MKYELSMFLSPKMTDEQAEKKAQELEKILAKFDATILESNFLGMKDLAYQIKHFNQGYYFIAKIEADPTKIKKIRYQVADEMDVVRLLVTKQEKDVKLEAEHKEKVEGEEELKKEVKEEKSEKVEKKSAFAKAPADKEEKAEVKEKEEKPVDVKASEVVETPVEKEEKPTMKKKEKELDLDKKLDKILEEDIID